MKKQESSAPVGVGNVVPQAPDIEEAVLGAMMLDPSIVVDSIGSLSEECFYKPENRKIFHAISQLNTLNKPIDILTVAEQLKANDDFDAVGGGAFLAELSSKIGAAAHADFHTKILIDKFIQRKMISISLDAVQKAYDDSVPVDELLDKTEQSIFELAERNMARETQKVSVIIEDKLKELQDIQADPEGHQGGLMSGYGALDRVTYGWHETDLIIIAARPSMGKTAFVITMARNMAVDFGIPVAFFSLEQSPKQLIERLLVAETGLTSDKIKGARRMSDQDWVQLGEKVNSLEQAPLYIDDTPALSITDFRAKARKLVHAGVKIIMIDYLQLMTGSRELKGNREQEVAEISRSLKAVAKELKVPIIALAQLSRATETQGGQKKPQLTHLRESGAIEQDADLVIFIHRPEYYGTQEPGAGDGYTELIIAKHRNGPTGEVPMRFIKEQMRFVDTNDMQAAPTSFSSKMNSESYADDDDGGEYYPE